MRGGTDDGKHKPHRQRTGDIALKIRRVDRQRISAMYQFEHINCLWKSTAQAPFVGEIARVARSAEESEQAPLK